MPERAETCGKPGGAGEVRLGAGEREGDRRERGRDRDSGQDEEESERHRLDNVPARSPVMQSLRLSASSCE